MVYLNALELCKPEAILHWSDPTGNEGRSKPMGLTWARYLGAIYQGEMFGRVCWVEDLRELPDDDQEAEAATA